MHANEPLCDCCECEGKHCEPTIICPFACMGHVKCKNCGELVEGDDPLCDACLDNGPICEVPSMVGEWTMRQINNQTER